MGPSCDEIDFNVFTCPRLYPPVRSARVSFFSSVARAAALLPRGPPLSIGTGQEEWFAGTYRHAHGGMRIQPPGTSPQHTPTPPAAPKAAGLSPKAQGSSASKGGQTERRAEFNAGHADGAQTERRTPSDWTDMEAVRRPSAVRKPHRPINFGTEVRRREVSAYSDSQGHSGRVPHATFAGVDAASEGSPRLPCLM